MKRKILAICLITSLLFSVSTQNAKADPDRIMNQISSVFIGTLFGPMFAMPRGAAKGAVIGTKKVARNLGDDTRKLNLTLGAIPGGIGGGIAGGAAGIVKGVRDAFKYGSSDPWSNEAFSVNGDGFLDYDPFYWED